MVTAKTSVDIVYSYNDIGKRWAKSLRRLPNILAWTQDKQKWPQGVGQRAGYAVLVVGGLARVGGGGGVLVIVRRELIGEEIGTCL